MLLSETVLFLISIVLVTANNDTDKELKWIIKEMHCDPAYTFNYSQIDSTTIKHYPRDISFSCGLLIFNEHTDVNFTVLKDTFQYQTTIFGAIRVENSQLTNLSFFPSDRREIDVSCSLQIGSTISNNSQLTNIDGLNRMPLYNAMGECPLRIINNPKLDASQLCEHPSYREFINMEISGNLKDCGCTGRQINSTSDLQRFENCTSIMSGLNISIDYSPNLTYFQNVKAIIGNLEVAHTNLQNLSFLAKVKKIRSRANIMSKMKMINIHDNPNMTRFGMTSLTQMINVDNGVFRVSFENLHEDFCMTMQEITQFFAFNVVVRNMQAKICEEDDEKAAQKVCVFISMSLLENDCNWIHGDLKIGSGDEEHLEKLHNVTHIFGALKIENTNIENVKFLNRLKRIASLAENEPAMTISNNPKLVKFDFPNIKPVITRDGSNHIVISNNGPRLFQFTKRCLLFQRDTDSNVTYNGDRCVAIDGKLKSDYYIGEENSGHNKNGLLIIVLLLLGVMKH